MNIAVSDLSGGEASPAPVESGRAARGLLLPLVVLTDDEGLLNAAEEAARAGQHPLLRMADWAELQAKLGAGLPAVALVDAQCCRGDIDSDFVSLAAVARSSVILGAGAQAQGADLLTLMHEGHIYRFLAKPVSGRNVSIAVESGARRHSDVHGGVGSSKADSHPRGHRGVWLVAAAASLVLVGAAIALMVGEQHAAHPQPTAQADQATVAREPDPQTAALVQNTADRLELAHRALAGGRLAGPEDSAQAHYLAVLARDPGNAAAQQGLEKLAESFLSAAELALLDQDIAAAARELDGLALVDSSHPRLAFMTAQLEGLRAEAEKSAVVAARPVASKAVAPSAAPPDPIPGLLQRADQHIQAARWMVSPSGNAWSVLREALNADAGHPRVLAAVRELQSRLLGAAESAAIAGDLDQLKMRWQQSIDLALDPVLPVSLGRDLHVRNEAAREKMAGSLLARIDGLIAAGELREPAGRSALAHFFLAEQFTANNPATAAARESLLAVLQAQIDPALQAEQWDAAQIWIEAARKVDANAESILERQRQLVRGRRQHSLLEETVSATDLELLHYQAPVFPRIAERRNIEGWVDLEFIVGENGATRDLQVIAAEPGDMFVAAALAAVEQWRFAPPLEDGFAMSRRANIRVRFALN